MSRDLEPMSKDALDHAWAWFVLHAAQRMQTFNFFLVATAFLVAGFGAVVERHPPLGVGIGVLGAWISLWFNRLEQRSKQLVKAGEAAVTALQCELAQRSGVPAVAILPAVEAKAAGSSSYSVVINVVQRTILVAFLLGALYAALRLWATQPPVWM